MRWRSDTVTTFHTMIVTPWMAKATTTAGTVGHRPGTIVMAAPAPPARTTAFIFPTRRSMRSATSEPSTEPRAIGIITAPNPASLNPSVPGATANTREHGEDPA